MFISALSTSTALVDNLQCAKDLIQHCEELRRGGLRPSTSQLLAALRVCKNSRDVETGRKIHDYVASTGYSSNTFLANSLVDMYAKCGCLEDANAVFDKIQHRDAVSWNSLVMGYAQNGEGEIAMQLYALMQKSGLSPTRITTLAALRACAQLVEVEVGRLVGGRMLKVECIHRIKCVHSRAAASGHDRDVYVATTLLDLYAKCGSMEDAGTVFESMPYRNVVSWTAVIKGYAQNGEGMVALRLYWRMHQEGCAPNVVTFVAALKACSCLAEQEEGLLVDGKVVRVASLARGRLVHSQLVESRCELGLFLASSLVDMYSKAGSMEEARDVFDKMESRNVVSWTAIILGYAQSGDGETALELFERMQDEGCAPNQVTYLAALKACGCLAERGDSSLKARCLVKAKALHAQAFKGGHERDMFLGSTLVDAYAKCGSMEEACKAFQGMLRHDAVSWNCIIAGYAQSRRGEEALQCLALMQDEGFSPDRVTLLAALKAITMLAEEEEGRLVDGKVVKPASLERCKRVHEQATKSGHAMNTQVANSIIDAYAKCGSMVDACFVFEGLIHRRTGVSWNCLIMGYAENGEGDMAMQLYGRMLDEGFQPDSVTFLAALKASGSLVSLETGKRVHGDIVRAGFESDATVASSLINFYGKCGEMGEAEKVFASVPTKDLVVWNALVGGYGRQGNTARVFDLFERIRASKLQPDAVLFLSLLTACSHAGLLEEGNRCFESMVREYGIVPGIEHYTCMVDLLGRGNELDKAVEMLKCMPAPTSKIAWMALLGACWKWKNPSVGKLAFDAVIGLDSEDVGAYVLMSNIYLSHGMHQQAAGVQAKLPKPKPLNEV